MPNMNPKKTPMPEQEPNIRNKNFKEVATGYTEEMALEEAQRCLQCKKYALYAGLSGKRTYSGIYSPSCQWRNE